MRSLMCVLPAMLLFVGPASAAQADSDAADIKGTWAVSSITRNGKTVNDDAFPIAKFQFDVKDSDLSVAIQPAGDLRFFGTATRKGKLGTQATPHKTFDVETATSDNKELPELLGIYELIYENMGGARKLVGMRWCLAVPDADAKGPKPGRPAAFAAPADSDFVLLTLVKEDSFTVNELLGLGERRPADQKKAFDRGLSGVWFVESIHIGGKELPKDIVKKYIFVFTGTTVRVEFENDKQDARILLNAAARPLQADFTKQVGEGGREKRVEMAIFELIEDAEKDPEKAKPDILRICVDTSYGRRPTRFDSADQPTYMLVVLKRERKKE